MSLPSERRRITRIAQSETLYPLCFKLRFPNQEFVAEVVNYHFRGACLRLPAEAKTSLDSFRLGQMGLDFYLGKRCLKRFVPFRIAWESLAVDQLLGVEFLVPVSSFISRPERFATHPHFPPLVTTKDPLNPNRMLYFKILNISENGMLMLSSLSNKHLLPGMWMRGATLSLPGEKPMSVSLRIANVRSGENTGTMSVGVALEDKTRGVMDCVRRYLSALSPSEEGSDRLRKLSEGGMLSKELRTGLTFRVVDNQSDYERVMKLRFIAYAAHGKVRPGTMWQDQGDGLENEGTIVGAFLGGELVGCLEMRFGAGPLKLKTLSVLGREFVPGVDLLNAAEVNRLAVHPLAQGSDIVLGLIQKIHALLVVNGNCDILILATNKLRPFYERIGFFDQGISAPHPVLEDEVLNLLVGPKDVYLQARQINILAWMKLYQASQKHFRQLGIASGSPVKIWRWTEVYFYGAVFACQQMIKRMRRKIKRSTPRPALQPEPERKLDAA